MKKKQILLILSIILSDQISKFIIEKYFFKTIVVIPNFFNLDFVYNQGGAFSLFSGHRFFILIMTVICFGIIRSIEKEIPDDLKKTIIFSLIYGGVIGNFWDRLFCKGVRDFFDFNFGGYHFPTFNIADIAIVIGFSLFVIFYILRKGENNGNNR